MFDSNKLPPIPVYKKTLIVCKTIDEVKEAQALFAGRTYPVKKPPVGFVGERYYMPPVSDIHNNLTVMGVVTEEHRKRFNVIDYYPERDKNEYYSLIRNEISKYNQQLMAYVGVLASMLPNYSMKTETWANGLISVSFYYNKEYSPQRALSNLIPFLSPRFDASIEKQILDLLNREKEFNIENELMNKFPNLYISTFHLEENKISVSIRLGINRGLVYGGTSMDVVSLDGTEYDVLQKMEEQARQVSQQGMFYCSLCHEVKPKSEYLTYYFSAECCRECGKKNPDFVRKARSETYH